MKSMSSIESESKETYSRALTCLLGLSPIFLFVYSLAILLLDRNFIIFSVGNKKMI